MAGTTNAIGNSVSRERERRLREAGLDRTIENTFPASDPPSTIPDPPEETFPERVGKPRPPPPD